MPKKANLVQTSTVVNLSGVALSTDESSLLSKGLSFCPTPRSLDADRMLDDLEGFFRRLRLKEFFADSEIGDSNEELPFRPTCTWMPPKGKDGALETYVKTVRSDVERKIKIAQKVWLKDNLSSGERKAPVSYTHLTLPTKA